MSSVDVSSPFDVTRFEDHLATAAVGRWLLYFPVVETTMVVASREAKDGAPGGTLVLAEEQTAGRGRRGRGFHSPAGENLYFTFVLRPSAGELGRLPLAVPLAVCQAVAAEGIDARIKWPNDIWAGGRKLSGMLIDVESDGGSTVALPGIGVNVNGDPTLIPELHEIATSVRRELGILVARERLLARICNGIEEELALSTGALRDRYARFSMILGRRVAVTPAGTGEPFEGFAETLAEGGALVVRRDDGRRVTVTAADVSLRPV